MYYVLCSSGVYLVVYEYPAMIGIRHDGPRQDGRTPVERKVEYSSG